MPNITAISQIKPSDFKSSDLELAGTLNRRLLSRYFSNIRRVLDLKKIKKDKENIILCIGC